MTNEIRIFESPEFGQIRTDSDGEGREGRTVVLPEGCVQGTWTEAGRCMSTVGKGVGFNPTPFNKRRNTDGELR